MHFRNYLLRKISNLLNDIDASRCLKLRVVALRLHLDFAFDDVEVFLVDSVLCGTILTSPSCARLKLDQLL